MKTIIKAQSNWEAAFRAVQRNDLSLVKQYINEGVDINYQHYNYFTGMLFESIKLGHLDMIKLLLASGADLTIKEVYTGKTPFEVAKDFRNKKVLKLFDDFTSEIN